jgi:predicted HicB family RNase H-like nuclease
MDHKRFTYRIVWSDEDQEFVGLCTEFPSLSWLHATMEGALKGIVRLVAEVVADMESAGEDVPQPISARSYSGKFLVRIPPERHRMLAQEAAEAGVSINRLVSARLSGGWMESRTDTPLVPAAAAKRARRARRSRAVA